MELNELNELERADGEEESLLTTPEQYTEMTAMPACIVTELADVEAEREKVLAMTGAAAAAEAALVALATPLPDQCVHIGRTAGALQGVLVHVGTSWSRDHALNDVRQAYPLMRELRARGWRYKSHSDYAEIGRRTYQLVNPDDATIIHLSLFFYVVPDSMNDGQPATCRFVQVGVKEQPVYELRCGGEAEVPPEEIE